MNGMSDDKAMPNFCCANSIDSFIYRGWGRLVRWGGWGLSDCLVSKHSLTNW